MAYDEAIRNVTLTADSSLSGYTGVSGTPGAASPHYGKAQYRFVKITGAKQCGRSGAADLKTVGVCQSKPQVTGQAATVAIRGISMVMAGGAFAAGDYVTSDAQGRAVSGAADGTNALGIAVEAATAADQVTSVLLRAF